MASENPLAAEMEAYAAHAEVEFDAARRANRLQGVVYGLLLAFLLSYLGWAFLRLSPFADPGYSAHLAADIAAFRIELMIGEFGGTARELAPSVVNELERQVVAVVPQFRGQLETFVAKDLDGATARVLSEGDARLVEALKASPEGRDLVKKAIAKPSAAEALLAFAHAPAVVNADENAAKPAVDEGAALLLSFRDTARKLAANRNLDAGEKAQRRLLQLIIAQAETSTAPAPKPADAGLELDAK